MNEFIRVKTAVKELGIGGAAQYFLREHFLKLKLRVFWGKSANVPYALGAKTSKFPLFCRFSTSDRNVFSQVFVDSQYAYWKNFACASDVFGASNYVPKFIVDCGANVGFTSAFLLSRFPTAHVVSIEPENGNYVALCKNLAPYGSRVEALHAGIWPVDADLVVSKVPYRDGREWAFRVRECEEGEIGEFRGINIASIIQQSKFERIDVLKIDIEGAEEFIFAKNVEHWIDKVDLFLIELHSEACRKAFFGALDPDKFQFCDSGELIMARRIN